MRRSSVPSSEAGWRRGVLSPYRCRACREQFWVISRRSYIVLGSGAAAIAVMALVGLFFELWLGAIRPEATDQRRRSEGPEQVRVVVGEPRDSRDAVARDNG